MPALIAELDDRANDEPILTLLEQHTGVNPGRSARAWRAWWAGGRTEGD